MEFSHRLEDIKSEFEYPFGCKKLHRNNPEIPSMPISPPYFSCLNPHPSLTITAWSYSKQSNADNVFPVHTLLQLIFIFLDLSSLINHSPSFPFVREMY